MGNKKNRNKPQSFNHPAQLAKNHSTDHENKLTVQGLFYQGPIPPPEALEKYEKISPGFADRIVKMAEVEQEHRHKIDVEIIEAQKKDSQAEYQEARIGQFCGLLIGCFAILCGGYTSIHGAAIAGGVIGAAGIGGLVTTFVYGRKSFPPYQKENSTALAKTPTE